ncbi:MFS transporter [Streptomyces subrutilus]|uniref:MFS transporter n=1 Tax=Streptomyces subrutilus TaxID=36818 RepID=A0A1E5Q020_9ACTN|nr:MFS transporter [Streptomyces subrutilus]OEJ35214.1 MFS transporter [Streptomyces subrutilus]
MQRFLRLGRGATFAYFALNGFLMGMWIVHIPVVEQRTGIDHALLGWLLLLLGGGAFVGMRLAGPLTDRIGPRRAVPSGAALCSGALVLPALATDAWTLGGALLVLGLGNGVLDVSMNTHAVQVERGYRRPVMSAFHAVFSVGGVLAALVGALTLSAGWSVVTTLAVTAVAGLAVAALALPGLLPHQPVSHADEAPGAARAPGRRGTPRRIWFLAVLAFMLMLCEGVANDWSVLHLKSVLGAPAATAAFAYGTFATAMTVGRLLTDRLANRFGATAILRYGAALGAAGLALAAFAPIVPLALIGWTLAGAGLSGCIPQLFSAAGHFDPAAAGANVSRVAGLGYLGMLAGPAVIGPLTHLIPLNLTLLLPTALCVIAAGVAARILKSTPSPAAPADLEGATSR